MKEHLTEEIEARCAALRTRIGSAVEFVEQSYMPFQWPSRTVLPPPGCQPAIVVRLDRDDVVPAIKDRSSYPEVERIFTRQLPKMRELCTDLSGFLAVPGISNQKRNETDPFWENPFFGPMDARVLSAVTRYFRPRRILEIGSGNSTKFFRKAIDDGGLSTRLTSIDPQPRTSVESIVDEMLRQSILDCPLERFSELESGDIVFLDGSHLTFHGCDTVHFFLRILPLLRPGVLVHLHDIYLPEEYPQSIDELYYSEQYMLAALLMNSEAWRALLPVHFLHRQGVLEWDGVSFWMTRN